ncbi:MAG: hypothetical protein ACPLKS_07195 [Caldisericum exile]|uniref:hypothetical protein n=1 Tax=Caldisericum TaxID=693074 RepID=UPI003C759C58
MKASSHTIFLTIIFEAMPLPKASLILPMPMTMGPPEFETINTFTPGMTPISFNLREILQKAR